MGAFSVEVATMVVDAAVIQRAEAHEAMLQGVVPLLVHVVVPDYILLTGKPLQKGRGGGQQVGVYLNQSQNQQQVTLSLWRQQLQHAGANWQLGSAVHTAMRRARMSLKMMGSVVIDLLCISQSCGVSKCSTKGSGTFWAQEELPHGTWSMFPIHPLSLHYVFPSTKMFFFFLIKMNQLTCKITVLMFLALEKLCSMQMVSKTCTGENRRQQKQTNKLANQKTFSLSIRWDIIPFLIKALTRFLWRLRP